MKFNQKEDGSCDIIFDDPEIEIIKKHKKLYLSKEFLRHFSNNLMKICVEFNKRFDEKTSQLITDNKSKIIGTEPKKDD